LATACTPDGHRLGQRRVLGRQTVRHLEREELREHHQLAVAAGVVVRVADRLDAARAGGERHRDDARAALERALRVRPEVEHLGAELVPHDHVARRVEGEWQARLTRRVNHLGRMPERVQVGAADAAGERADEDLARAGHGLGDRVHHQLRVPHHRGAHHGVSLIRRPGIARGRRREHRGRGGLGRHSGRGFQSRSVA